MQRLNNRGGQPTNEKYLSRMAFDLSFFIWVGLILFNIITGLLVDGFSELRQQDKERQNILATSCFVCGKSLRSSTLSCCGDLLCFYVFATIKFEVLLIFAELVELTICKRHSGFSRVEYDDLPNFKGATFNSHKDIEHDPWGYVYFWIYLDRKHKEKYSYSDNFGMGGSLSRIGCIVGAQIYLTTT
jgi:hypothetical protein